MMGVMIKRESIENQKTRTIGQQTAHFGMEKCRKGCRHIQWRINTNLH